MHTYIGSHRLPWFSSSASSFYSSSVLHYTPACLQTTINTMARLTQYNYVFAIGTFFAMLDAYNNGASEWFRLTLERYIY